jgi:hypothetical protein
LQHELSSEWGNVAIARLCWGKSPGAQWRPGPPSPHSPCRRIPGRPFAEFCDPVRCLFFRMLAKCGESVQDRSHQQWLCDSQRQQRLCHSRDFFSWTPLGNLSPAHRAAAKFYPIPGGRDSKERRRFSIKQGQDKVQTSAREIPGCTLSGRSAPVRGESSSAVTFG